jgi:hypothetical protein
LNRSVGGFPGFDDFVDREHPDPLLDIRMGEAKRRKESRAASTVPPASEYPGDDWQGSATPAPSIAPGKTCGSCTKCCTVLGIPELKKRAWDRCPHVELGTGCTIYAERPSSCRKFICGWLMDPDMGPDLKPEKCHVVFYQINEQHILACCDADYPGAWRAPNVTEFLHRLARSLGTQRKVIVKEINQTWIVTEDAIVLAEKG